MQNMANFDKNETNDQYFETSCIEWLWLLVLELPVAPFTNMFNINPNMDK